jgi:glycosyltransferase involved in cell wall biosynthesis
MRVLFLAFRDVSNPCNGGGDIYINELARGCAKKGHEVTFISSSFPGAKTKETVDNINVIRLGSNFTMFFEVFTFYFRFLRDRFDIIVEEVMGGPRIPFFSALYMKEKKVGILQQRHREIFHQQFPFLVASSLSLLERFLVLIYKNNNLIVNSARTKEDLRKIGYSEKKMHIIYPGLHNIFLNQKINDFSSRKEQVICLTKLRRYKLVNHAIQAMDNVREILPSCRLIVAGKSNDIDPEYETEIRHLVNKLNLKEVINFELNISEERKRSLLNSSRALILPSVIEGFSIVVIEANACGTPAVTSDRVPAAINGQNAVVTPCFDVNSMSKAIVFLLTDKEKWSDLSSKSVAFSKQFTWEKSVNKFDELIKSFV